MAISFSQLIFVYILLLACLESTHPDSKLTHHASELPLSPSPVGQASFFSSWDIALWNQSVSGDPYSGQDIRTLTRDQFPEVSGQFQDLAMSKDEIVSMNSSLEDSTYMSQSDAGNGSGTKPGSQFQTPHVFPTHVVEPYFSQGLYSPTVSSENRLAFTDSRSDIGQMMLPQSGGQSEFGDDVFYSQLPATSSMPHEHWHQTDMPSYGRQYSNPRPMATPLQRRSSGHGQHSNSPLSAYPAASMSNSQQAHRMPSQSYTSVPVQSMHTPTASRRPSVTSFGQPDIHSAVSPAESTWSHGHSQMVQSQMFSSQAFGYMNASSFGHSPVPGHQSAPRTPSLPKPEDELKAESASAQASADDMDVRARAHPLYQAAPEDDDLYHCPFEKENCPHKPTKLKCNYDKYVDSHLKPFRCKVQTCIDVQFSSTACLLRHEREAHGMHGHGSKPHLCSYPDCERSLPGNGFPRRYNLFDHMKRVHDYTGPTSPPDRPSTTEPAGPKETRIAGRKRKSHASSSDGGSEKRSRASSSKDDAASTAMLPPQSRREKQLKSLHTQWSERRSSLQQRLQIIQGPTDVTCHQQISEDVAALHRIAAQLNELG